MLSITSREMSLLPKMERLASTLSRLTCAPSDLGFDFGTRYLTLCDE